MKTLPRIASCAILVLAAATACGKRDDSQRGAAISYTAYFSENVSPGADLYLGDRYLGRTVAEEPPRLAKVWFQMKEDELLSTSAEQLAFRLPTPCGIKRIAVVANLTEKMEREARKEHGDAPRFDAKTDGKITWPKRAQFWIDRHQEVERDQASDEKSPSLTVGTADLGASAKHVSVFDLACKPKHRVMLGTVALAILSPTEVLPVTAPDAVEPSERQAALIEELAAGKTPESASPAELQKLMADPQFAQRLAKARAASIADESESSDEQYYLVTTKADACYRLTEATYVRPGERPLAVGRAPVTFRGQQVFELPYPPDYFLEPAPETKENAGETVVAELLRHECGSAR